MNLLAIVAALALEQWRAFAWQAAVERAFVRYARRLERNLNGGRAEQGALATLAALVPPVVVAAAVYWLAQLVHPLLGIAWNVVVLLPDGVPALLARAVGDRRGVPRQRRRRRASRARSLAWRLHRRARIAGRREARDREGLVDAYRQVFAVLFWFTVLPGPAGAVLYRAALLLAQEWRGSEPGDDDTPIARSLPLSARRRESCCGCSIGCR